MKISKILLATHNDGKMLFYVPDLGNLSMEEEARVAHRRVALKKLFDQLT